MSRRSQAPRREILPDPKYGNDMLAKFVNMVMRSGKKSIAEKIVYGALHRISERSGNDDQRALEMLGQALDNIKPAVEVKSRRVGGATYQVPVEVRAIAVRAQRRRLGEGEVRVDLPVRRRLPHGHRVVVFEVVERVIHHSPQVDDLVLHRQAEDHVGLHRIHVDHALIVTSALRPEVAVDEPDPNARGVEG
jgi:ribosomal protein S7